jgi:hypothetical protein
MEAQLAAIEKFCRENEGSFALGVSQKGGWSAMLNFGREAPDSPMAGGSAIGGGGPESTAAEAITDVVEELHLDC